MKEIKELNVPIKKRILYLLISIGISIFIFSGVFCVLINLLLFKDLQKLVAFGIATVLCLMLLCIELIYYKAITNSQIKGLRIVILTDLLIQSLLVYCVLIILFTLGVF